VPALNGVQGGPFNGPVGLTDVLLRNDVLDGCAATQLFRFAMGRLEDRGQSDSALLASLTNAFRGSQHRFEALLLDLVASEGFNFRRNELPGGAR
jgi:hypothetical protein